MVETIQCNYEGFTKKEIEQAINVWCLQGMLDNNSDRDLVGMVHAQVIPNRPFNVDDCKHAAQIFGKNLPDILGKTVRHKPERVMPEYPDIPMHLTQWNKLIMLTGAIMFVNGLPFLITSLC